MGFCFGGMLWGYVSGYRLPKSNIPTLHTLDTYKHLFQTKHVFALFNANPIAIRLRTEHESVFDHHLIGLKLLFTLQQRLWHAMQASQEIAVTKH